MAKRSGNPIKVAVLALGRSGWNIHVAVMRDDPHFRIVSVLDPDDPGGHDGQATVGCGRSRRAGALSAPDSQSGGLDMVCTACETIALAPLFASNGTPNGQDS